MKEETIFLWSPDLGKRAFTKANAKSILDTMSKRSGSKVTWYEYLNQDLETTNSKDADKSGYTEDSKKRKRKK